MMDSTEGTEELLGIVTLPIGTGVPESSTEMPTLRFPFVTDDTITDAE